MTWRDLLVAAEAVRAAAIERDPSLATLPLAGIGWATVDQERAALELDAALAADAEAPAGPWIPLARDPGLGARGWRRGGPDAGGSAAGAPQPGERPALVLLEPDTEGRVAASLARFGEGVTVIYVGDGPPGPGRLVRGGPAWGPHVVVLSGPA